jgi:hypothetical protein
MHYVFLIVYYKLFQIKYVKTIQNESINLKKKCLFNSVLHFTSAKVNV